MSDLPKYTGRLLDAILATDEAAVVAMPRDAQDAERARIADYRAQQASLKDGEELVYPADVTVPQIIELGLRPTKVSGRGTRYVDASEAAAAEAAVDEKR